MISVQIIDEVVGDITALYFVAYEADPETVLAEGIYPINDSWWERTVVASTGMDWDGSIIPSYYAGYSDGWLVEPYYFLVSGEVTVVKNEDGELSIEINALNSCDIPVHIVYGMVSTSLSDIQYPISDIQKTIQNGQLLIIRNGKAYNAVGVQVK